MRSFIFFIIFLLTANSVFAYNYTENDKNMFYDAFLDGYFTEMQKVINNLEIDQTKKDKFMTELKKNVNKQELIKSSWDCIKKYPIKQIISASVICTVDWNKSQENKNKELFELLK